MPLLGVWENPDEIDLGALPERFVLKCSHNSGGVITCLDKASFNWKGAKRALKRQLRSNYYAAGREWLYKDIPPRELAEAYIRSSTRAGSTTTLRKRALRSWATFCVWRIFRKQSGSVAGRNGANAEYMCRAAILCFCGNWKPKHRDKLISKRSCAALTSGAENVGGTQRTPRTG